MSIRRKPTHREGHAGTNEYADLIELWILRILIKLKGHRQFVGKYDFSEDEVMYVLGLEAIEKDDVEFDKSAVLSDLRFKHRNKESQHPQLYSGILKENVAWLQKGLDLSNIERDFLVLLALMRESTALYEALELLGEMSRGQLQRAIATILDVPLAGVCLAMRYNSTLIASGLVHIDIRQAYNFCSSIDVIDGLQDALLQKHQDRRQILAGYFTKAPQPRLSNADYLHVSHDYGLMRDYLTEVTKTRVQGVNILIYGPTGTGKTQLVRVIAKELGLSLYEVAMQKEDGDPLSGEKRFSVYQLTQSLLRKKKNCAILFDEVEDVFQSPSPWLFGNNVSQQGKKAWINQLLENNPVPAFWLSNEVEQIDLATLRRFDYSLELRTPAQSVRRKMLKTYLKELPLRESWFNNISELENLAPAHIERAAKVASALPHTDDADTEKVLERIIGNMMQLMGNPRPTTGRRQSMLDFRLDILNVDTELPPLISGIGRSGFGRLCLYGPPGTGKTAFATHLAKQLDRPLIKKRASDLMSMWVGQCEKNIARMFQRGRDEEAVLLLDEADSFLQERSRAKASWEISQVNELLVQMESYDGIFIASTNLMDLLDQATFRRFDIKIHFNYLTSEQALILLRTVIGQDVDIRDDELPAIQHGLARLSNLAIGDFSALLSKQSVTSVCWSASEWVDELEKECALKPDARHNPIGFVD